MEAQKQREKLVEAEAEWKRTKERGIDNATEEEKLMDRMEEK